jgi:hypothetical protein
MELLVVPMEAVRVTMEKCSHHLKQQHLGPMLSQDTSRPANPFHARLVVEWHKYKAAKTNRM